MLISKDYKKVEVVSIFPTDLDLLTHILSGNDKINPKSSNIKGLIDTLYQRMLVEDGLIKWSRFSRWYPKELGFKKKNIQQVEFWLERGWSKDEALLKISEISKSRGLKVSQTKNLKKGGISFEFTRDVQVKFKGAEYITNKHPKCNECDEKLKLKKTNRFNREDDFYYTIESCGNNGCPTNSFNKSEQYIAFLPKDVAVNKLNELTDIINKSNPLCVGYWLNKGYSEASALEEISSIQSKNSKLVKNRFVTSKENLIKNGFSDNEIKDITLTPSNIDFWVKKGHTIEEASKLVFEHQSNAAKHVDYDKRLLPSNVQYWVDRGYSYNESKDKVRGHQTTFSKEICIEKYGEEEGLKRFTERQKKWNDSLNSGGNLKVGYSKISQELFYNIMSYYNVENKCDIKFATHNGELRLNKENGGMWLYDFTDIKNKKIIEYHGDQYHGNPKKYLAEDYPHPFRKDITAKEMWDKDKLKLESASKNGYELLVIWDSEYRWGNKQKVIDKCLDFLGKK